MSGLQITITAAGRAALVNAENTGTAPVRIAQIGVSASSAGVVNGVLDGEIKRLATFAGAAVADDTVHVTIRDDGPDAYSLRSFALYLEGGTLFAWYAHASGVILEKSTQAMLLLAADIRFVAVNAASLAFGDTDWINPPATTTVQGVVELADNAEAIAGVDGTRAMTPAAAKAAADDRLGVGAPTTFVKSLLNLATAALFRAAIGLGNAATRNEGAGNGLDADLLDGQHGAWYRDWANLQNVPAAFTPIAHTHAWNQITGAPDTAIRWPTFAEVTNKPASYPPSAHSHAIADVAGLQSALDGKASLTGASFTGNVTVTGQKLVRIYDLNGTAANLELGAGYSNGSDGHAYIANRNAGGFIELFAQNGGARLRVVSTGPTFNDNSLWHAGNFNPATKANTNGQAFTGLVSAPTMRSVGGSSGLEFEGRDSAQVNTWYAQGGLVRLYSQTYGGDLLNINMTTGGLVLGGPLSTTQIAPSAGNQGFQVVWNTINAGNGANEYINNRGGGGGGHFWYGRTTPDLGPNLLGYLTTGGVFVGMGGFQNGSSGKIKDIEGPNPYGLAEIEQIQTVIGRYKPEFVRDQRRRLFVIAEQLQGLVAEPVTEDALEFRGERVPTVDYMQLVPVLIRGVQELAIENRVLRREQAEQRAAIKQILDRLADAEARS